MLSTDGGLNYYVLYKRLSRFDWRVDMVKIFENPRVQARYRVTNENIDRILEAQNSYVPEKAKYKNAIIGDIVPDKVGYLGIKQMVTPDSSIPSFQEEYDSIKDYLQKIKDYQVLIIDIRQNGGGNSGYWSDFLMPLIVHKEYSQQTYSFIKGGDLMSKVKKQSGFKELNKDIIENFDFPKETLEIINDFSHFTSRNSKLAPNKDSIDFKGKIYQIGRAHV